MKGTAAGPALTSSTLFMLVLILLVSCATLPPPQPAKNLQQIAGAWKGWGSCGNHSFSSTLTFQESGTWENIIVPPSSRYGSRFVGTIRVGDGKYHVKSETTGRIGVFTLHEGEGKRVLVWSDDKGECEGRLTPIP